MRTYFLYLTTEFQKAKRRGILLVLLALWLVQAAYISWGLVDNTKLSEGWLIALYNLPLINAVMLPTVFAVLASRLIDYEHKENTWKLLETLQSKKSLFLTKTLTGFCCVLLFSVVQLLSVFLIGTSCGFDGKPDLWAYGLYFLQTVLISFVLFLLQMLLSLLFTSQAVALSVGLCGSMAGLFIMFLPRSILYEVIPWGLYGATMFVGMDWNPVTRYTAFYYTEPIKGALCSVVLWIIVLLFGGWKLFEKRPVEGFFFAIFTKCNTTKKPVKASLLPAECIKLKRTPIWLAFILLPLISALIGTFNYAGNLAILDEQWYSLWSQHTLFLCYFFMPALLGVYCSYLWRMEHTGTNWNQLMVHVSPWKLVKDKLLTSVFVMLLSLIWIMIIFLTCGKTIGITASIPDKLPEWLFCGFVGGTAICALQLFLSLILRSFAVPIGIALAGSIAGLAATAKGLWYLLPYSLLSIGMRANNPHYELNYPLFFAASISFSLFFYLLSVLYLKKADVKTQN